MVEVGTDEVTFQSLEPKPKSMTNSGFSETHVLTTQIRGGQEVQVAGSAQGMGGLPGLDEF